MRGQEKKKVQDIEMNDKLNIFIHVFTFVKY